MPPQTDLTSFTFSGCGWPSIRCSKAEEPAGCEVGETCLQVRCSRSRLYRLEALYLLENSLGQEYMSGEGVTWMQTCGCVPMPRVKLCHLASDEAKQHPLFGTPAFHSDSSTQLKTLCSDGCKSALEWESTWSHWGMNIISKIHLLLTFKWRLNDSFNTHQLY